MRAQRMLRRALERNGTTLTADDRIRLLISLSLAESELHGVAAGLDLLVEAEQHARAHHLPEALINGQRGVLWLRAGNYRSARSALDAAAGQLADDDPERIKVLINRGVVALRMADLAEADRDFTQSLQGSQEAGLSFEEAVSVTNLGYLSFLRGDLPEALRRTGAAEEILAPQSAWLAGVCARGRADVLLAAGLLDDAEQEYRTAVSTLTRAGHRQERGQAALGLAEIHRLQGRYAGARRWARRALATFTARGAAGWALLAELELAWTEALTRPSTAVALAAALEPRLLAQGLREEAAQARLLRIRALLSTGDTEQAEALARTRRGVNGSRMSTRMLGYEVRSNLAVATGRVGGAQRIRRHGLADLHARQARFGSVDLLTAATRIGTSLATDGLRHALSGGRTTAVLEWSELLRATSARMIRMRPPRDPETARLLAALRHAQANERDEQLEGQPRNPARAHEVAQLRRAIRSRDWGAAATREVVRPVDLPRLRAELGDAVAVSLMLVDGLLHTLAISADATRHTVSGASGPLRELTLELRADLDQLARDRLPARMRDRVTASAQETLRHVDHLLAQALEGVDTGGPVLVVPTGQAALLPWNLVPRLRHRRVCVVPSLTWWVRARAQGPLSVRGREVLIAGPELTRGVPEILASAENTSHPTVLIGDQATVGNALAAMDGAGVLHVAAHGRHEPDNPQFSRLLLADGWLYGHDLDLVPTLPEHALLSACEAGMASIRPGDEALGLTSALLQGGCRSVVSSVAAVNDEVAELAGVAHHERLRRGDAPADALAGALAAVSDEHVAPLVCFGLGW